MSLAALLRATQWHLKKQLPPSEREVGIHHSGQPPPTMGAKYIAIHSTLWTPGGLQGQMVEGIPNTYGLDCTITFRCTPTPLADVANEFYINQFEGMEQLAARIVANVQDSWTLLDHANNRIATNTVTGEGSDKIVEALEWLGTDAVPRMENGLWLGSDDPESMNRVCALVLSVHFGNCRRYIARPRMNVPE